MQFLKDFGVDPLLFGAQVVNFLILLFILKKILFSPILNILEERQKRIEDSMKKAQEADANLLASQEKRREIIKEAAKHAEIIIEQSKNEGESIRKQAIENAKKEAADLIEKTKETMNMERELMKRELAKNFVSMISLSASKILGGSLTKDLHKKIQAEALKEIKE